MKDRICTGELDTGKLQSVVDELRLQAKYGIVESLTDIDFPPPHQEPIDVAKWPKGRIFSEAFELRWELIDGNYRTLLAGEDGLTPPAGLTEACQLERPGQPVEYYCWNERNPRLGRTLDYRCVPGKGHVKLLVWEYRDDHGRLIFWRYTKMKRERGNP